MRWSEKLVLASEKIKESARLKLALEERLDIILAIVMQLASALRRGNKVLFCGNGGSAADAQHMAAELAGKMRVERAPLPAIALTTNTSVLTALANDYGFEEVFARQVGALAGEGDVVVGISTSGNSVNVILALEEARRKGALAVAFTGRGGRLKEIADLCLDVPSDDTPRIQEIHIAAGHIICELVEAELYGGVTCASGGEHGV